ncbi:MULTISPECIES: HlyD family secretion protein [Stenotrophomonas]|jgi:membrane fusion protein, multidrug efflux system|uniref:HlyD family secretion protein n=1 Tax=Stenotrophomonas pavanii TaxID=487698 RepID=A0A246L3X0_9GAMM|nr:MULTISPECIES: HlyD family secretion protein [Stenotrophomonas]MBC9079134.1 HlyD family secretion protein [Stenotrophomonas maltophilia]MBC9091449.1 HlyD family secretion protein [Stenotrophomonas maltophilia]MBH1521501.1 HlyD family secretion protein [Stenotrophomonas maltophilia]MBN4941120.1 HlyD family secretion protein [Stenotrophomonas maltophilia]MBN5060273.1 HlyD family secretion protein [Stenotrophomonas maltophilia]
MTEQPARDDSAHDDDRQKEQDTPSPLKNPRVRWTLAIIGLLVAVALVAWLVYHLLVGRYLQDTNNAYLQADAVAVAPRINGYVTEVLVKDNQWVKAGEPLLRIDPRTYRATLDQAEAVIAVREADIAAATAGVQGQQSSLLQARTQLTAATASLRFARSELARFTPLAASGADTHEHVESLRHDVERAQAQYDAARAQIQGVQSQIDASQAQLEQAQAGLKQAQADAAQARVAFEDTELRARIDGRIGNKTVQVGQFVAAGTRTMTVVPVASLYLSANFKETQVGLMRAGQPAEIKVDALPGTTLHGTVESISPGTGSQFALLPPQNATGNFTKVVQRVPVRIRVDAGAEARKVLVPGMSVEVTVDTRSAKDASRRTRDEAEATAAPVR